MSFVGSLGDAFVGVAVTPPTIEQRRMASKNPCDDYLPWYCRYTSGTVLGVSPAMLIPGCTEALAAAETCKKVGWLPGPTVPEGGATGAATVRTKPDGSRETGQEVLDRQIKASKDLQNKYFSDFFKSLPVGETGDDDGKPGFDWVLLLALVIFVGGLLLAKK